MNRRILIADDEPNMLLSLEFLMKRAGFEVTTAADGQAALDAIAGWDHQVIQPLHETLEDEDAWGEFLLRLFQLE